MIRAPLTLYLFPHEMAICRLPPEAPLPDWASGQPLVSATRTSEALSLVVPARTLPQGLPAERGWRLLKVKGPLAFDLMGILASLLEPLARARVPVFVLSTYETDYLLVRRQHLKKALAVLQAAGHRIEDSP